MTKRQNHDSYLSEDAVLERVVDTSDKIARFLEEEQQNAGDERARLHLENLIELQKKLSQQIAEYRERAPWQAKETYMQYVDPGSGKVDSMIDEYRGSKSINEVTKAALAMNEELAEELQHVSINQGVEESQEAFDNLQFLVRDTCRKISMDRSMARDV